MNHRYSSGRSSAHGRPRQPGDAWLGATLLAALLLGAPTVSGAADSDHASTGAAARPPVEVVAPAQRLAEPAAPGLIVPSTTGAAAAAASGARSELFLSWHAPFGEPRATAALAVSCVDSTATDTLYLSFRPGRGSPGFAGFSATLMFRPVGQDTLGDFWHLGCGRPLPPGMSVKFDPEIGYRQPWRVQGAGGTFYDCREGGGRLRIVWAVPANQASGIHEDTLLTLGRLVIRHPPARFERCNQPVCIEWSEAELVYEVGAWGAVKLAQQGDHRFVSWNSNPADACAPLRVRGVMRPKPWSPKAGGR